MPNPEHLSNRELSSSVMALAHRFVQRFDRYATQLPDGRYVGIAAPLTQKQLYAHLRGEMTLGTYLLNPEDEARFLVIDADDERSFIKLRGVAHHLSKQGIYSYLETSRRGGHLWLFFEQEVKGKLARQWGSGILAEYRLPGLELYPKQDRLKTGPGSLIRMPFGVHRRSQRRYGFITPSGQPLAPTLRDQLQLLMTPHTVPPEALVKFQPLLMPDPGVSAGFTPIETATGQVSERLKAAVSVATFVGQYMPLTPIGSGLLGRCPFHEDEHPSFGVNEAGNFWHCFAGCGGGSIIDFWMKYREIDFKTALSELAKMLL